MKVCFTPESHRSFKNLTKRHRSLKQDFSSLLVSLLNNPEQGTELFAGVRKVRMDITSKALILAINGLCFGICII